MKIIVCLLFISALAISAVAQDTSIEKNFEKNKRTFSVKRFAIGEDASSGSEYLVYRQKTSTKKIRVIWSNYERAEVDDYFYEAGKPLLMVKYAAKKSQVNSLAKGTNLTLKTVEKFYFTDSKLVTWIENGKKVPADDSRWAEKEKDVLESFASQLETFRSYLKGEL
jgi:hypothetical protein